MMRVCVVFALVCGCVSAFIAPAPQAVVSSSVSRALRVRSNQAATATALTGDPMLKPLCADDYVAVGLALCFQMNENNKLQEHFIYEPLTAGTLETMAIGVETSYKCVMALKAGDYFIDDPANPTGINIAALKPLLKENETATMCENALERSLAAVRTMRRRKEGQLIAIGDTRNDYNFDIVRNPNTKRILNMVREVSFDDNVKQDKSIDVYGRDADNADEVAKLANL